MNCKKICLNKKVSRYIRRDSKKDDFPIDNCNLSRNINENRNLKSDNINKNFSRLSSYVIRGKYVKRESNNEKQFMNKSSALIKCSSEIKNDKINFRAMSSHPINYQIRGNQPRTPLLKSSRNIINKSYDASGLHNRRSVQTPQISFNKHYVKMNNMVYYIRCPYCHHKLNQEPEKENNNYKNINTENKENLSHIFNNDYKKYETERKRGVKKITIKEKEEYKNFFINEKGVIVFKQNDKPITSVQIITNKPDLSRYSGELKIFGKKRNISIYESPVPETKVIIRPIKK